MQSSLFVLIILSFNIVLSIWLENHTRLKQLGAALLVILITAVTANVGIIPSASDPAPIYDSIFEYVAPASIFFLMLGVNLKAIKTAGMPMIILFLIGSVGTFCGVLIADLLFGESLGENRNVIAGMITGTYTGGSLNFNAVALHFEFMKEGELYTSIVAVDNILTAIWMVITLAIPVFMNRIMPLKNKSKDNQKSKKHYSHSTLSIYSFSILILISLASMFVSSYLSEIINIPSILILTTISLLLAQFKFFQEMEESKILGLYLIYLFLAVIGAYCEINAVLDIGTIILSIIGYLVLTILIHGAITLIFTRILKYDWGMAAVASQANIGGSSSALALAKSINRNELLLPAVLIGTLGNGIGTYLGFLIAGIL